MKRETTAGVEQLARHLRLYIHAKRVTLHSIERELGMGEGYLGQLLRGNLDLKVKHVLAVLDVLGVEPAEFFASLYPPPYAAQTPYWPPGPPRFDLGSSPDRRMGEVVPGVSEARLEQVVRQALLRMGFGPPQAAKEEAKPRTLRKKEKGGAP